MDKNKYRSDKARLLRTLRKACRPLTIAEISSQSGISNLTHLNRLIADLRRKGLIESYLDGSDRKSVIRYRLRRRRQTSERTAPTAPCEPLAQAQSHYPSAADSLVEEDQTASSPETATPTPPEASTADTSGSTRAPVIMPALSWTRSSMRGGIKNIQDETILVQMAQKHDKQAQSILVQHLMPTVLRLAGPRTGVYYEDRIQEAVAACLKAIQDFVPSKNLRLTTFAHPYIRHAVLLHWRTMEGNLLSPWAQRIVQKVDRAVSHLRTIEGIDPTHQEVAELTHLSVETVRAAREVRAAGADVAVSISNEVDEQGDETVEDLLVEQRGESPEKAAERQFVVRLLNEKLKGVLNERERFVIESRLGIGDCEKMTFEEIGAKLDISKQSAYKLYQRILETIREVLGEEARDLLDEW